MEPSTSAVESSREPNFLLAKWEKRALRAIAGRLPSWILPDDLSAIGVLSAAAICTAYVLSNGDAAWLWLASALLVVHWLGDSLDGTLARVRGIQRPRYGYYLDHRGGVVSFEVQGIHPHDIAELCDREGVCIRAGHHCAQPLMREMGVPATARASFHVYNSREDVDRLVDALQKARKIFEV